jgi:hypothetical protein
VLVHKTETGINVFEIRFGINIILPPKRKKKAIEEINIKKINKIKSYEIRN